MGSGELDMTECAHMNTHVRVCTHRLSCSAAYGIVPDQGLNSCLLHWQAHSSPLSHQGSSGVRFFEL